MVLSVFLLLLCLTAGTARAGMFQLNDGDLQGVIGQSGISINIYASSKMDIATYRFSDTEATPNWIQFNTLSVDDGAGGPFSFSTQGSDYSGTPALEPNTIDVGTNAGGVTYVAMRDSSRMNPRWYSVGELVFCNQSLGSIDLDKVSEGPAISHFGSQQTNNGINFDYQTAISADALTYTYNTALDKLSFSGIHIVGSATGDPTDPSAWAYSGTFNIGDIGTTPASMDVGTNTTTNTTSLYLSLPMTGSIRMENVAFGGNNFGPVAIDGIQVHHLYMRIGGL